MVNNAIEQDDLLIVLVPQRRHPINGTEEFGEELIGQFCDEHLLLAGNDRRWLGLARLGKQLLPFEEGRNATLADGLVFNVESPDNRTAHLSPVTGSGDQEGHRPLLHEATTLARLEIPAVILGLPEALVELTGGRFAFNGHQRHVAVMDEKVEPKQTLTEWILDLKLRMPRLGWDSEIIQQRPNCPIAVFVVV